MVQKWVKGVTKYLSRHFSTIDFDCKCTHSDCTYTLIDTDLIKNLTPLCDEFKEVKVNSGFRCSLHNEEVGGKPGSFHMLGKAADIACLNASPIEIFRAADKIKGFNQGGMGLYGDFVHLDVRGYRSRWSL